jgi:hypothetical protein|tara:strand:+ start:341 stop:499 length:159 start_codon:yes stop_codon:yes gene_type:complete
MPDKKEKSGWIKKKVNHTHIDELWDVINEMQENINFLNDKVDRVLVRMGLQS